MSPSPRNSRLRIATFSIVVGSFVVAMLVLVHLWRLVDDRSDRLRDDLTQSVSQLARINIAALGTEVALTRYLASPPRDREPERAALETDLAGFASAVHSYLALEVLPGERPYWSAVQDASSRLDETARAVLRADDTTSAPTLKALGEAVDQAAARVTQATVACIEHDAGLVDSVGAEVAATRQRLLWLVVALLSACVLVGVAGAALLQHRTRVLAELEDAQKVALEAKAAELEQFAGRVAHDLRNPISAAALGATLLARYTNDPHAAELIARIQRALGRADSLTKDLLAFARAGARPDPGALTSAQAVIEDVVTGMGPEAARSSTILEAESSPAVLVRCASGVYLSLISNLVRNAIKYMGDAAERRVVVRVKTADGVIRTEVSDSGPGIALADQRLLFEPYFQIGGGTREGLGLGLATVKKLAEGHGGRVGVVSRPGAGSTFWFELPGAAATSAVPGENAELHASDSPMHH